MRPLIFLGLSFLLMFNAKAQNWQWFPKDSLRVYINPTQQNERLTGIDFRDYLIGGDTTDVNLNSFTRPDTLSDEVLKNYSDYFFKGYVVHGNSNFGNRILETPKSVRLLFKNVEEGYDTLLFYKNRPLTDSWLVFRNDSIQILAEVLSNLIIDGDSVSKINLHCEYLPTSLKTTFNLTVSKSLGLIESPVFLDILQYSNQLTQLKSVELSSFKEMTEFDFYRPKIGTVVETSGSRREDSDKVDFHQRDSCVGIESNRINWLSEQFTNTIGPGHYPYVSHHKDLLIERSYDTTKIYNPIPGKVATSTLDPLLRYGVEATLGGKFLCDLYLTHPLYYTGSFEYLNDTIFEGFTVDPPLVSIDWHVLQHVGILRYNEIICTYFNIPGGCEMGEQDFRFSSLNELSHNQIKIYPNPTSNWIEIEGVAEVLQLEIVDYNGKTSVLRNDNGRYYLEDFANGLYFIRVETEDGWLHKQIVIQH